MSSVAGADALYMYVLCKQILFACSETLTEIYGEY